MAENLNIWRPRARLLQAKKENRVLKKKIIFFVRSARCFNSPFRPYSSSTSGTRFQYHTNPAHCDAADDPNFGVFFSSSTHFLFACSIRAIFFSVSLLGVWWAHWTAQNVSSHVFAGSRHKMPVHETAIFILAVMCTYGNDDAQCTCVCHLFSGQPLFLPFSRRRPPSTPDGWPISMFF